MASQKEKREQLHLKEAAIQNALAWIAENPLKRNTHSASKKFGVPKTTLYDRYKQRATSTVEIHHQQQLLNNVEEEYLTRMIILYSHRGLALNYQRLKEVAEAIFQKRTGHYHSFGDRWYRKFLKRHDNIQFTKVSIYLLFLFKLQCV